MTSVVYHSTSLHTPSHPQAMYKNIATDVFISRFLPPVTDLHSNILEAPRPSGSKFFKFHAVFREIWQNRVLAPPPRVALPTSEKSWICHCYPLLDLDVRYKVYIHQMFYTLLFYKKRWNLIPCCFMCLYQNLLTRSSQQETGLTARPMPVCDFSVKVTIESVARTSPGTLRGDGI